MTSDTFVVLAENDPVEDLHRFGQLVEFGLLQTPKTLPSMYFYDDRGSEIWQQITQLTEYYPTRAETDLVERHARDMLAMAGTGPVDIIELGAGCNMKTFHLLEAFVEAGIDAVYCPVDISLAAMQKMSAEVSSRFDMPMNGIVGMYEDALAWVNENRDRTRTRLFCLFGSNLGNMPDADALRLLGLVRSFMRRNDRFIIGFDMKKDLGQLMAAYNDPKGITAEFNYNLLDRINRELGGTFDRTAFVHHPFYDPALESMVSWLVSRHEQSFMLEDVCPNRVFCLREGEGIRTEMSRKWSTADIAHIAYRARFAVLKQFINNDLPFSAAIFAPI